jgi:hypothetical protein
VAQAATGHHLQDRQPGPALALDRKIFQKSYRAALGGESKAIVVAAVSRDESMVGIIEIRVLSELFWRRLGQEAAVATALLLGKEASGH